MKIRDRARPFARVRHAGVLIAMLAVVASTLVAAMPSGAEETTPPESTDLTASTTTPTTAPATTPTTAAEQPSLEDAGVAATSGDVGALALGVELSKDTGLDPAGESITISASGFDASLGYYVMFCKSTGNPTGTEAGRPTGSDCDATKQYSTAFGAGVGDDGSFSTTMSPVAVFGPINCHVETCGVFVRRDHNGGAEDYSKDVFVPVTFAPAGPTVVLSKSTDLDPDGEAITVSASGFTFGEGYYVMFCKSTGTPPGTSAGRPSGSNFCDGSKQYWTNAPAGGGTPVAEDGTFSTTISPVAAFGPVDCYVDTCGVFVRRDHNGGTPPNPVDYTKDVFTPVTFASDGPTVVLSKSTDLDPDGEAITVSASGFTFGEGYYVMFCKSTGTPPGTSAGRPSGSNFCDGSKQYWTNAPAGGGTPVAEDGTFSTTISPVAAFGPVDCYVDTCGVFVRRDHNGGTPPNPVDYTKDVFTPVTFATPGPTVVLSKSTNLDPDGEAITVTGSGFDPTIGVYVRVCKQAAGELGTIGGRPTGTMCDVPKDQWLTDVADDGTISTTISPVATFEAVDCTVDTCGIFVRRDHFGGETNYSQDAFTPIAFGESSGGTDPGPDPEAEPGGSVSGDLVPGGTATATLWGFAPLSSVDGWLHSTPVNLGSHQANANGTVTINFTIPFDFVGDHSFEGVGIDPEATALSVSIPFTIAAATAVDPGLSGGSLAYTGSTLTDLTTVAVTAAVLGLGAVVVTRRRRRALVG